MQLGTVSSAFGTNYTTRQRNPSNKSDQTVGRNIPCVESKSTQCYVNKPRLNCFTSAAKGNRLSNI